MTVRSLIKITFSHHYFSHHFLISFYLFFKLIYNLPYIIITFIILFPLPPPPQSLTLLLLGHCNLCFIYVSWACIIIEKKLLPITESISRKFFTRNKREIPTLFRKLQSLSRHDTCTYYLAFYVSPWLGPYFTFSLAFLGSN